jgi:hypothetical protein
VDRMRRLLQIEPPIDPLHHLSSMLPGPRAFDAATIPLG